MSNDHEGRIKRLEELILPKIKSKIESKFFNIDPTAVCASLREKGWSQSDLAAQMFGGYKTDKQGKRTAIGKDRISVWLAGKNRPSKKYWDLLRKFVDVV